jgi:PAS domain S-box-containing protein
MKILVVDDNIENIEMMKIMLKSRNYDVTSAANGQEALKILRSGKYDLIISDILMPVMDGFKLCRECKKDKQLKNICFIFYTATYIDDKDEEFAMKLGAQKFIRKPQEPEVFLSIINELIEKSGSGQISPEALIEHDEKEILKLYSERLITKLEKKNLDLENEIASHKETEEKLKESEERLALAVEGTMDGLWDWNILTDYIYHSDRYASMLGYKSDELPNTSEAWGDLLHPDNKDSAIKKIEDCLAKKNNYYESIFRMKTKSGSYKWIHARGKVLYDKKGTPYRFVGFHTDITEKKKADEALRESEERFRFIFEYSSIGKALISPDGNFIHVNYAIAKMLDYSVEELEKLNFAEITHPSDMEKSKECMRSLLANELDKYRLEKRYLNKNGEIIWVDVSASLLRTESGDPKYFITSVMDITEKKERELELIKAKEKAEESDKLKTAFLHNISHEIRTPLNAITGFSDMIASQDPSYEKRKEFSQIIRTSSDQLLSIINDIITIATIEAGHEKLHEKESDINMILQLIKSQNSAKTESKNLAFTISSDLNDNEATVKVDKTKLIQILNNLVSNAIKFTHEGYIKVNCWLENNSIKFSIEDTGIGIQPEMHERIFERFFQIDYGDTRLYGGTGLGLSIVKSYIQLLKGQIRLESVPEKGSAFIISIPYKPSKRLEAAKIPVADIKEQIGPATILIVEDETANYELIREYLSDLHLSIIYATDGLQAVKACENNPSISLVLMDVKMPRMDGYEAACEIKKFRPGLPIVIQTAYIFQNKREKSMSAYIDGFIEKPINKDVLMETLQKKLSNP